MKLNSTPSKAERHMQEDETQQYTIKSTEAHAGGTLAITIQSHVENVVSSTLGKMIKYQLCVCHEILTDESNSTFSPPLHLTLLHSEWPKLYGVLAVLSAKD